MGRTALTFADASAAAPLLPRIDRREAGFLYALGFREAARSAFAEETAFSDTTEKREEDRLCP